MNRFRRFFALALTVLLELPGLPVNGAESRVALAGHVPKQIQTASKLDRVAADESVSLSLMVKLDQALLDQTLAQLYGPNAPRKRHYLTSAEFAQKFGIAEKRQKIKDFAQANGLTVDGAQDEPDSLVVKVSAPAHVVEQAFSVQLNHYRAADGQVFRGSEVEPMVPVSLAPQLNAVLGLSNFKGARHPHLRTAGDLRASGYGNPHAWGGGTGQLGGLAPADIRSIYSLQASQTLLTGSGQTAAVFELDGYNASDITLYATHYGIPNPTLQNVLVDGAVNNCGSGCVEVALDIELIAAIATGLSKIQVYEGPNTDQGVLDTYNKIATDNTASTVSTSWGLAEDLSAPSVISSENTIFSRMAAQGQSLYAAAGDSGAYDDFTNPGLLMVDDPASQPFVTGVGGTGLSGTLATHTETVWNDGPGDAGGGGISTVWTIPSYQVGVAGTASQTVRNVPDVSLNADPNSGYSIIFNGSPAIVGGTSAAAPLWAAMTALINQQRQVTSSANFGFANPTLYQLGTGSTYSSLFIDITSGNNLFYSAHTGYDNATGWGSYIGSALIDAVTVVAPPVITQDPVSLTVGVGQPATFRVQATGVGNTYQWQQNISGVFSDIADNGTGMSYSTAPVATAGFQATYRCQVTNAGGSVVSNAVTLTLAANNDLGHIIVYPNPWDTRKHSGVPLHFSGLPDGATVKIFTLSAHWVKTLTPSGGAANWDLTNDSGQSVGSGYYLYVITDNQGEKITGKLAVIK